MTAIDVQLKLWCKKHERPYLERKANMVAACNRMIHSLFSKVSKGLDTDGANEQFPKQFEAAINELAESGRPICCYLTEEEHELLFADAIPSTGDERQDEIEAVLAVPEVQPDGALRK